ncbi:MAG: hypothetical protein V1909_05905 [Candidatus Micrarchaeota archaeon]
MPELKYQDNSFDQTGFVVKRLEQASEALLKMPSVKSTKIIIGILSEGESEENKKPDPSSLIRVDSTHTVRDFRGTTEGVRFRITLDSLYTGVEKFAKAHKEYEISLSEEYGPNYPESYRTYSITLARKEEGSELGNTVPKKKQ